VFSFGHLPYFAGLFLPGHSFLKSLFPHISFVRRCQAGTQRTPVAISDAMSDAGAPQGPTGAFHACNRCRKRKARCVIPQSASSPDQEVACLRCKRERKQCVFASEKSTKPSRRALQPQGKPRPSNAESVAPDQINIIGHVPLFPLASEAGGETSAPRIGQFQDTSPVSNLTDNMNTKSHLFGFLNVACSDVWVTEVFGVTTWGIKES
jgi:hypothetical protein